MLSTADRTATNVFVMLARYMQSIFEERMVKDEFTLKFCMWIFENVW